MYTFNTDPNLSKEDFYKELHIQVKAVISGQRFWVTNLSNVSSLIFHGLNSLVQFKDCPINWAGFYISTPQNDKILMLGPFQGKVACTQIRIGKGVCGTAAEKRETQVVPDVRQFPGHIACDSESNSEIVIPLISPQGEILGVLDIDSTAKNSFGAEDKMGLETLVQELVKGCDWTI